MHRAWNPVASTGLAAVAAVTFAAAGPALAQPAGPPSAAAAPSRPAAPKAAEPRKPVRLSPEERAAIDASGAGGPLRVEDELAPTPEDMRPRAADDADTTRIEQRRVSNRVSEVVVTPAGRSHSYVMTNREGRQPFGTTQMNSGGLSVPMFFRFEFGRSTPPATTPPLPPAPPPPR